MQTWDCVSEVQAVLRSLNLLPGDKWSGIKPVCLVLEPTSRRQLVWGAACLYSFRTYLMGTVGQGCSQFIQFLNLFRNVLYSKSGLYFSGL